MTPPLPERFGPYEVEHEIGRGGMGIVYAARDPGLARRVAIKVLPPELAADPDRLDRLRREARALAALDHPNIATIHGMDEEPAHGRFLVLEYVPGLTVADRLMKGPLGVDATLALGVQVADALAAAHARGVVHRDIKPRNLMLGAEGRVKVLDFGLARRVEVDEEAVLSAAEAVAISQTDGDGGGMGTASYLSPERILGDAGDTRGDLFSLGCVLHECLTGRRTFRGATRFGALAAALGAKVDWSDLPADTPDALRDLLAACLQKKPEHRPSGAREVRDTLEAIRRVRGVPTAVEPQATTPHNLPDETTSFVGREEDLAACEARLEAGAVLTLTGLGGSGKTRLARRLAERALHRDLERVWWIELATALDRDTVLAAVAGALAPEERPAASSPDTLASAFGSRRGLVVLDNCEDVRSAVIELVEAIRRACPGIELLLTSRVAVGVADERAFAVAPLPLPEATTVGGSETTALMRVEAVRLFVDRARAIDPRFALTPTNAPAVVAICRRLDGMPLALELAAARMRLSSLAEISARLEAARAKDAGGLRLALEWSVGQLDATSAGDFARLAVFVGGWTLEAAGAVCAVEDADEMLDRIGELVDASLVVVERGDGPTRYRFLEPVRQFALEQLRALGVDEAAAVRERHLTWCLALAEERQATDLGDAVHWQARVVRDTANFVAALDGCDVSPGGPRAALRLITGVGPVWGDCGLMDLRRTQLERALRRPGADEPSMERVRCLGMAAISDPHSPLTEERLQEALDLAVRLGDRSGEGSLLNVLGERALGRREFTAARACYERGLAAARDAGNVVLTARILLNLGHLLSSTGDREGALQRCSEAVPLYRQGTRPSGLAMALTGRAYVYIELGRHAEARADLVEALGLTLEVASVRGGVLVLCTVADLALAHDAPEVALCLLSASRALGEGTDTPSELDHEEEEVSWTACRERLDPEDYARASATGQALSLEDAHRYALTWLADLG